MFLGWLEACLLSNIAKCESNTLAQFHCLNFVSDMLIGQSKRSIVGNPLWAFVKDPPAEDKILIRLIFLLLNILTELHSP